MAKYKIQAYNKEMTELVSEYEKDFGRTDEALIEAYEKADGEDIIVLMRQSIFDSRCWKIVAKFY